MIWIIRSDLRGFYFPFKNKPGEKKLIKPEHGIILSTILEGTTFLLHSGCYREWLMLRHGLLSSGYYREWFKLRHGLPSSGCYREWLKLRHGLPSSGCVYREWLKSLTWCIICNTPKKEGRAKAIRLWTRHAISSRQNCNQFPLVYECTLKQARSASH